MRPGLWAECDASGTGGGIVTDLGPDELGRGIEQAGTRISAWMDAIRAISETMASVAPRLDRLIEAASAGGAALAPLRPVAADLKIEDAHWRSRILPVASEGLNARVQDLAIQFGDGGDGDGSFARLARGLEQCRAEAEEAGRLIAGFSERLHDLRRRLASAGESARRHFEGDAARLQEIDEHARQVMEEAINHVRAIKESQSKWYSGIFNSVRVIFNISGLVTGFINPDRLRDLGNSVDDLFGTLGITDGIPDHLKQRIERIERDRREIARHAGHLADVHDALAALDKLVAEVGKSLQALTTVASSWAVIESKIATVADAQARIDGPIRFLYVKTTAAALRQLAAYTRQLQAAGT